MATNRIASSQSSPYVTFYLDADVVETQLAPAGAGYGRWRIRYYLRMAKGSSSFYGNTGVQAGRGNGVEFGRHQANPFLPSGLTSWNDGPWDVWVNANSNGYWSGTSTTYPLEQHLVYGNISNVSYGSITLSRLTSAPSTPPAPVFVSATTTSVAFTISAPSSNGGSAILDYTMQVLDGGTSVGTWVSGATAQDSSTVGGLTLQRSKTYQVRYFARNAIGNSPYSATTNMTTLDTVPDKPDAPIITGSTNNSLSYFLSDPAYFGSSITGREVQISLDPSFSSILQTQTTQSGTFSSLLEGTGYYLRFRVQNAVGWSAWSDTAAATTTTSVVATAYWVKINGVSRAIYKTSVKDAGVYKTASVKFTI